MEKMEESVLTIDKLLLGSAQKMRIFDAVLMSMLSCELLIHDMSASFAEELGAIQTRTLKKWSQRSLLSDQKEPWLRNERDGAVLQEDAVGEVPFTQDLQ